jgi:hypothetical protein
MRNGTSQMRVTLETLALKTYHHGCWNGLARFATIGASERARGTGNRAESGGYLAPCFGLGDVLESL